MIFFFKLKATHTKKKEPKIQISDYLRVQLVLESCVVRRGDAWEICVGESRDCRKIGEEAEFMQGDSKELVMHALACQ